jgi:hypothetical protein
MIYHINNHMIFRMENENENENINRIIIEILFLNYKHITLNNVLKAKK